MEIIVAPTYLVSDEQVECSNLRWQVFTLSVGGFDLTVGQWQGLYSGVQNLFFYLQTSFHCQDFFLQVVET